MARHRAPQPRLGRDVEPLTFELPAVPEGCAQGWRRCIDTAKASPDDIARWEEAPPVSPAKYPVQARSVVLLAMALECAAEDP